jgi:hypothetical protein
MRHYKTGLTVLMILLCLSVKAQIRLNLALSTRPQPWLADWANPVNGVMIITYMEGPALNDPLIKIKTTLLDQNENVIGISNINASRIITLRPGVNQFSIADALQLQNLTLNGGTRGQLQRTGRLAAGQYQLKVELFNTTGEIVRDRQTKPFFVTAYQLPILISPTKDGSLYAHIAQTAIIFRWTPVIPQVQQLPEYRVQVFEVLPGQTDMQAFRGNRPLLDEAAIKGSTQYIWRPNLPMLDSTANRRFVWTIQTLDINGQPLPTTDNNVQGRSEPSVFRITGQTGAVDKDRSKTPTTKP